MCDGKHHNLEEIAKFQSNIPGGDNVVRWCSDCGAIVIDVEIDNRIYPGKWMKMKFPKGEIVYE